MSLVLKPSTRIPVSPGPLLLVVMDGVGIAPDGPGNAVTRAHTPTLDRLTTEAAFRAIRAHGTAVGLPTDEDMGNSEVGHNAMGAGKIYDQGARRVNQALESGEIFETEVWARIRERCLQGKGALHLIGLLSDGNVHSHEGHLHRILEQAAREGFPKVYVHALLDGRDVPETSALEYIDRLEQKLAETGGSDGRRYRIASGGGRMKTTMDRYENDWGMVERGWNAQVHGEGRGFASAREAVETYRAENPECIDQYLPPFVITESGKPVAPMEDGDAVVLFNFRGDRALEVSRAFDDPDFDKFDRGRVPDLTFAGMTLYDGEYGIPRTYLVPPPAIRNTVSEYLAGTGVAQYAVSETQKFGHMTYFWNGNRGGKFDDALETYEEIRSDGVPFDQRPWMQAAPIADQALEALRSERYRFLRLNFANGDMVGHTGRFLPTLISMEALDLCLARILAGVREAGGTLVVTADHGNAEDMLERGPDGAPVRKADGSYKGKTAHTTNPVGLWIWREGTRLALREDLPEAGLANLASTLLDLLGYAPPEDYLPSMLR